MANEFVFSDVAHAAQHVCLTLPLRDYCIGHRLLFLRQRNPLAFSAPSEFDKLPLETKIFWLIDSVTTCNQTYAHRCKLEKSPTRWMLFKFWRDSRRWRAMRAREQAKFADPNDYWSKEIEKFRRYLDSSRIITDYNSRRDGFPFLPCGSMADAKGRALGGPYDATLTQFLIKARLCTDSASAMEYPFALAEIHYLTHLEREGSIRIFNDQEIEDRENADARDLEAAKAAGFNTVEEHVAHITAEAIKKQQADAATAGKSGLASEIPVELK